MSHVYKSYDGLTIKKRVSVGIKRITTIFLVVSILLMPLAVNAHSGRTDSSGGHRDNKNASGLGSYHYHHGCGPHLHPNGICPYSVKNNTSTASSSTSNTISNTTSSTSSSSSKKAFNIKVQNRLNDLGYDCGKADGKIGKKTKDAIKAFQQDKGLVADGIIGDKTRKALGL